METKLERCSYRRCKNEFTPHGDRRFCSERCQQAAAYGRRRTAKGPRKVRLRPLATPIATAIENGHFSSTKTVGCKQPKPSQFATPLDILGRGHRWPDTPSLDRETWEKILWREVGAP
jgi:hypothetical protein